MATELIPMGIKGQGPRKGRSVKLPPKLWEAVEAIAADKQQSVNFVVEKMVEHGVCRYWPAARAPRALDTEKKGRP